MPFSPLRFVGVNLPLFPYSSITGTTRYRLPERQRYWLIAMGEMQRKPGPRVHEGATARFTPI
jgi:hypothetical protein